MRCDICVQCVCHLYAPFVCACVRARAFSGAFQGFLYLKGRYVIVLHIRRVRLSLVSVQVSWVLGV